MAQPVAFSMLLRSGLRAAGAPNPAARAAIEVQVDADFDTAVTAIVNAGGAAPVTAAQLQAALLAQTQVLTTAIADGYANAEYNSVVRARNAHVVIGYHVVHFTRNRDGHLPPLLPVPLPVPMQLSDLRTLVRANINALVQHYYLQAQAAGIGLAERRSLIAMHLGVPT